MSQTVDDPLRTELQPTVRLAERGDAAAMVQVIHAAFGARPALDPPSTADAETASTVAEAVAAQGGVLAEVGDQVAGVILFERTGPEVLAMRRVSVHPDFQRHGIGAALVLAAEQYAAAMGLRRIELGARAELPALLAFWQRRGYTPVDQTASGPLITVSRDLPVAVWVDSATEMQQLGRWLATLLEPGDLILASGSLGAGKTTLTQGIGAGLCARSAIISPTFVLSRVHATAPGRPTLVHVDAYRLSGLAELEDLDIDASLAESVTVVEWGRGLAETITEARLEIDILHADETDDSRLVLIRGIGARWTGVDLANLAPGAGTRAGGGRP